MNIRTLMLSLIAVFGFALFSLQIDTSLSPSEQFGLLTAPSSATNFAEIFFVNSQLPRFAMAILVGAMLGLVGSLMQQLTQNNLTSPLTLGSSSGAWLALVIMNVWFVDYVADYSAIAAMVGALVAFGLIVAIAGIKNMTGLPLVVSGMVINILLGSIAAAIVVLNSQFAQNVFMWGAGDLTQYSWEWFEWLLPKTTIALIILLIAPRILTILRLGQEGATARGLSVLPAFGLLMLMGIWLVSASITAVGIISFIGLLTPNIARALGARTPRQELISSAILGAGLLILTDTLAMALTFWSGETIPSGVTAAAIGAPALMWFSRKSLTAQDQLNLSMGDGKSKISLPVVSLIALACIAGILLYMFGAMSSDGLAFALPGEYQWQLRLPRLVTVISVGLALAVAGVILQRLVYNPLASPDILGVSSGATFAIVTTSITAGSAFVGFEWSVAFIGSITVLIALLLLGKKHNFNPSNFILSGIALTAMLEAFIQFSLAKGTGDSYKTLLWLTGSSYRVTQDQALLLFIASWGLVTAVLLLSRWLTVIAIGRQFANARGLNANLVNVVGLSLVALLCAFSTATMGPVAFVGLVAPHMAMMLGAKRAKSQILISGLVGITLMIWADWFGQVMIYPFNIAAGTLVAIMGSGYFLLLMMRSRFS
ncbi:Fe(3+)-hydroxamate ABC transporter permease FhuB [Vibrio sp. 99-70-13A1]|uniref:Fe(3+)-hydroxamate ABC transporter permease FhuB n=1 Tax=Vibrio sp. 99-70-13A1 TaxID=2607601 RepID=UPI001493C58E|nr:Fe(3+)-hydroxamate ABC transporter permease FhuB [Vibrio sp. 99-70-13A1]NOH97354.1 Fe(3+)-hydroxamate ABC transporter permease FhuB [Vibrio sp. 99-70-13A1]